MLVSRLTLRGYLLLVLLYVGDELLAHGYIVLQAEHIPNGRPRQRLALLQEGQTLEALTCSLVSTQRLDGLQEGLQHTLLRSTRADYIGTNAVDRSIEVVQTDVYLVECAAAGNLLAELEGLICEKVASLGTEELTDEEFELDDLDGDIDI